MADEEQWPSEILRGASRYVGAGAGVVAVLGKGIGHAFERSVEAAGGLLAPSTKKRATKAPKRAPRSTRPKQRAGAKPRAGAKAAKAPKPAPKGKTQTQARTRASARTRAKEDQAKAGPKPDTKKASRVEADAQTAEPSDMDTGEETPFSSKGEDSTIRE